MKRIQLLLITFFIGSITAIGQTYQWGGSFGGVGDDVVRAMAVDDEGNVYTTGYFTDTADLDPTENQSILVSNGFFDIFIQKVDPDGNLVGAFGFGGEFFDYGTGIEVDGEGNIYLTGVYQETVDFDPSNQTFELTSLGAEDIFALKLSPQGQLIWAVSMGSPAYEEPVSIGTDDEGNVYIGGYFSSAGDYDPGEGEFELTSNGSQDAFVVKLDENGQFVWAYNVGGAQQELLLGMDVSPEGDVFLTGPFSSTVDFDPSTSVEERTPISSSDSFVLKLNTDGEFVYVTTFGGVGSATAYDVAIDSDGNAFAAGSFTGSFSTGFDSPITSLEFEDAFVVKIDAIGDVLWAAAFQGLNFQNAYDVNTDPNGNVVLAGYFGGEVDFDPSDEAFLLAKESSEPFDAFVTLLDSDGELIYAANFGGSNFTEHHGVDTDSEGNIYLSAAYQNTVDINPDPDAADNVSVVAFRDSYLIKLSPSPVSVSNEELPEISLYPNPAKESIAVNGLSGTHFRIVDALGKTVRQGILISERINIHDLAKGLYLFQVDGFRSAKFIKN